MCVIENESFNALPEKEQAFFYEPTPVRAAVLRRGLLPFIDNACSNGKLMIRNTFA
jgi:hypothetical protein